MYIIYYMEQKNTFSKNLKIELQENHLSQEKLAEMIGVKQATVSRWVSGYFQPDYETLFKLCKILKSTPNLLLGWEE